MNVEQKLAAFEDEFAQVKSHEATLERGQVREMTIETIKNARRPGGVLHKK